MYTCLMYHEVVDPPLSKFTVSPSLFKEQMKTLISEGVASYVLGEETPAEDRIRRCLLTFDDGHGSNLKVAHFLSELNLTGYFYLVKDYSLEREGYLNENEIKEIASLGHKIGVHGKNHAPWTSLENQILVDHLNETKKWIEDLTGVAINTCSAPGGFIDKRVIKCIHQSLPELKYIRTSHYGINNDNFVLNSIGIRGDYTTEKVVNLATNEFWAMRKIMAYYYIKQTLKPLYHALKKK